MNKSFIFNALDKNALEIVINAMEEKTFKEGEYVMRQGEEGNELYIVESGNLDCYKLFEGKTQDKFIKRYEPGESFGELALLYSVPRQATIISKTTSILWELDRQTFNHIVKGSVIQKKNKYEQFIQKIDLFRSTFSQTKKLGMDNYEKAKLVESLKPLIVHAGDYVIRQGDNGDTFYIIESGCAVALKVKIILG